MQRNVQNFAEIVDRSNNLIVSLNKLGQSCDKLCSSFESFANNIYTLTVRWLAGWVAGSIVTSLAI